MAADLRQIAQRIAAGPFAATWDSLEGYTTPNWYQDAKFGIFIHWGVYAVPAFGNEWYPRNMYLPGTKEYEHHRATYGPQDEFGYKDFIPHFTAEHFDAEEWVRLFAEAGARFVVPVAEHHDGFQMYASDLSHWNAAEMGPKRDVVGGVAAATRRGDGLRRVQSSRRALVVHGRRPHVRFRRPGPRLRRFLRPGARGSSTRQLRGEQPQRRLPRRLAASHL
ncbi:MAG: alpha-L-fucosidase [Caldilineaceae bacterium]